MIYQIQFEMKKTDCFMESLRLFYTPKRYKNESGQHLEHSPFANAILFCLRS
jgi:homogentisate 1,2-dioxygenase